MVMPGGGIVDEMVATGRRVVPGGIVRRKAVTGDEINGGGYQVGSEQVAFSLARTMPYLWGFRAL